jgi:hypothetical protein
MAKQGQHKHDGNDPRISKGVNRPTQSQPMTSGSYKKPETHRMQALQRENPEKQGQFTEHTWNADTHDAKRDERGTRQRPGDGRSGSQSNAS